MNPENTFSPRIFHRVVCTGTTIVEHNTGLRRWHGGDCCGCGVVFIPNNHCNKKETETCRFPTYRGSTCKPANGLMIDVRLNFKHHLQVRILADNAKCFRGAMPRRLPISRVVRSVLLNPTPVWATALHSTFNAQRVSVVYRKLTLCAVGYAVYWITLIEILHWTGTWKMSKGKNHSALGDNDCQHHYVYVMQCLREHELNSSTNCPGFEHFFFHCARFTDESKSSLE